MSDITDDISEGFRSLKSAFARAVGNVEQWLDPKLREASTGLREMAQDGGFLSRIFNTLANGLDYVATLEVSRSTSETLGVQQTGVQTVPGGP